MDSGRPLSVLGPKDRLRNNICPETSADCGNLPPTPTEKFTGTSVFDAACINIQEILQGRVLAGSFLVWVQSLWQQRAWGGSPYDWGRCCLMISLDWGGILSGKWTENSTMRSPRCDGFLGKGRPSPLSRFTIPGLMMSWQGREMTRFSSVGMLTVQPHRAWRGEGER